MASISLPLASNILLIPVILSLIFPGKKKLHSVYRLRSLFALAGTV